MAKGVATDPGLLTNRLALRVPEAARALGISERQLRQLLPELPHTRLGGCVVLPVDALREWLSRQVQTGKGRVDDAVDEVLASLNKE